MLTKQQIKERDRVAKQREQLNNFLRQNGFCWVKGGFATEEDADSVSGFAQVQLGETSSLVTDEKKDENGVETRRRVTTKGALVEIAARCEDSSMQAYYTTEAAQRWLQELNA